VVAKLKGGEVTRLEVFNFIQTLPPQTKQLPLEQLYPMALEQVINGKIIAEKTKNVNLDSDAEVKKQLAEAKKQITRNVYIEKLVSEKVSEERLKEVYEQYVKQFPDIQDVKARHILVKEESKAKELIKQLNEGKDFAELATANSTDGTAKNGGELGYFAKNEVVPAFGEAAFALDVGQYSKKPVKTDFGFHIIKVEEKRKRPPAAYDDIKPYLETQVRRAILDETVQTWRDEADIERFDINGDKIEPSAGEEKKEAAPTAPAAQTPPATPPAQ
jgi:peptidyl-prolyl cis-trans isomerase C